MLLRQGITSNVVFSGYIVVVLYFLYERLFKNKAEAGK